MEIFEKIKIKNFYNQYEDILAKINLIIYNLIIERKFNDIDLFLDDYTELKFTITLNKKKKLKHLKNKKIKEEDIDILNTKCSICYEDFKVNEYKKILPCKHNFHTRCINSWFKIKQNCPICKIDCSDKNEIIKGIKFN